MDEKMGRLHFRVDASPSSYDVVPNSLICVAFYLSCSPTKSSANMQTALYFLHLYLYFLAIDRAFTSELDFALLFQTFNSSPQLIADLVNLSSDLRMTYQRSRSYIPGMILSIFFFSMMNHDYQNHLLIVYFLVLYYGLLACSVTYATSPIAFRE